MVDIRINRGQAMNMFGPGMKNTAKRASKRFFASAMMTIMLLKRLSQITAVP